MAWAMAQLSAFLQRAGVWFLASLSEAGGPGRAPRRSSDSKGQRPRLCKGPHLHTQHPAKPPISNFPAQPRPNALALLLLVAGQRRKQCDWLSYFTSSSLQDLGGPWRRPPLSIRGWRALIGLGRNETCPRRFLQTLGREIQGGAE